MSSLFMQQLSMTSLFIQYLFMASLFIQQLLMTSLFTQQLMTSLCRQEFTAYAKKALDRLTRSIVQTSGAIQSSKWLAGAKIIYEVVKSKRTAQGLETKPFSEWAGIEQEVDRLVAGKFFLF